MQNRSLAKDPARSGAKICSIQAVAPASFEHGISKVGVIPGGGLVVVVAKALLRLP